MNGLFTPKSTSDLFREKRLYLLCNALHMDFVFSSAKGKKPDKSALSYPLALSEHGLRAYARGLVLLLRQEQRFFGKGSKQADPLLAA